MQKWYPSVQPYDWCPCEVSETGVWCALHQARLGLTDEETVEQIRENAYMQFFLGFAGHSSKTRFAPLMMVHPRKRFTEEDLNRINEVIAERGKTMVIEAMSRLQDDDNSNDPGADVGTQISIDDFVKPAD